MAILRFALTYRTRIRGSQSATHVVQYLTREGRYAVFPENDVRYMTRTSDETQDRGDLRHVEVRNLPAWAHGDATTFFEAAYQQEGVNRRYAAALQIALPRELSHEQQLALARDFMEAHLHDKPYLWVKHEPLAKDGQPQPHIHILCSTRMEDGIARGPEQFFKRYNRAHPERGGAQKDPFWNEQRGVGKLRESWAILTNIHLERAGVEARVDPRELRAQGIARTPGTKWQRSPEPRDIAKEQAAAVEWWDATKAQLNIARETGVYDHATDSGRRRRGEHGVGRDRGDENGTSQRVGTPAHGRVLWARDGDSAHGRVIAAVRAHARQGPPGHYPTRGATEQALVQVQAQQRTLAAEEQILTRALGRTVAPVILRQGRRHDDRGIGGGLRIKLTEEEQYGRGV